MSEAVLASQLPSATAFTGLSGLATDTAGSIRRVAMICMNRSLVSYDLDELTETGLYGCGMETTNGPEGTGCNGSYVLVLKVDGNNVHQLLFHRLKNALFYRQLYVGKWGTWRRVSFEE